MERWLHSASTTGTVARPFGGTDANDPDRAHLAGLRRRHGHRFHRRGAGHRREGLSGSPAATAAYPCPSLGAGNSPARAEPHGASGREQQQVLTGASTRTDRVADSGRSTRVHRCAPLPPPVTPAISGTLRDHLREKGVKLEAQRPHGFKALDITLPMPPRWTQVPDPNVPDAFVVIADRLGNSVYTSNAQLVVYRLIGDFDPAEAITHGYIDSQKLLAWQTTNASMANFDGFPSSIIEGTYRENDMTLNTSRRHVIATSGADKYLVSLSVTTALSQAVTDGPATDAIVNGFQVVAHAAPLRRLPRHPVRHRWDYPGRRLGIRPRAP